MRNFTKLFLLTVNSINNKRLILIGLMLISLSIKSQNIGINATGAVANASAMLDIVSTTKGLLIPRMTHANMTGIGAPATGLLVYTTDAPASFYYYNGAAWVPLLSNSTTNGGWALTGNTNCIPSGTAIGTAITGGSNFIGTADTHDFVIATSTGGSTYERMRITSAGNVGISNNAPGALLDIGTAASVLGVMRLEGSTSGYVAIQASAAAGNWSLTLPGTTGTNGQVLTTDGTGIASWTTIAGGSAWGLTGNSATTPSVAAIGTAVTGGSNFIGTTDLKDFVIATNNGTNTLERMRVGSGGNIGISNNSPGALLDIGTAGSILGAMRLEGNTSGYVGIQASAAAGNWNLTLPTGTGTNGQVLTTDGAGVTSWTTPAGGGVTSVTGTAPIYCSPTVGAVVVSIQGTNSGAVLYSTGTGNSALFNAQGNAPDAKDTATQVLVSQGTAAPTWNNIGGANLIFYKGDSTIDEANYNKISQNMSNYYFSTVYGKIYNGSSPSTQLTMPKCVVTRVKVVPAANSFSTSTTTFTVMKNNTVTSLSNTLAHGSTATTYLIDNPVTFADGDYMEVKFSTASGGTGTLSIMKIEVTYYPLP